MRERKYKVWDKEENKWLELGGDTYIFYDGQKMKVVEGNESYGAVHDNVEIVEYTGLKDKSGNELYEGDLIPHKFDKKAIGIVTYGNRAGHTGFHVEWKNGMHKDLLRVDLPYWASVSEVIGNVFDNPEMLQG